MAENIKSVNDSDFENEVLKSPLPVVVDFWASWCAPCRTMSPIYKELSKDFEGKIKFTKLNVDESQSTPTKYGIRGIPTIILFKNGTVMDQLVGAVPKSQLLSFLNNALGR